MEVHKARLTPNTALDSMRSLAEWVWSHWGDAATGWALNDVAEEIHVSRAWKRRQCVVEIQWLSFFGLVHRENGQSNTLFFFKYFRWFLLAVLRYEGHCEDEGTGCKVCSCHRSEWGRTCEPESVGVSAEDQFVLLLIHNQSVGCLQPILRQRGLAWRACSSNSLLW